MHLKTSAIACINYCNTTNAMYVRAHSEFKLIFMNNTLNVTFSKINGMIDRIIGTMKNRFGKPKYLLVWAKCANNRVKIAFQ